MKPLQFHVTLDFNDDIWYGERTWDEETLRGLIRFYAERGVSGVHWIDYGTLADGMYDRGGYMDRLGTVNDFLRRVPNPLAVVADEAHRCGMRAYSVLKIFDLCGTMPWEMRPRAPDAHDSVKLPLVGGETTYVHRWFTKHPEMRAELHPSLQERGSRRPVGTIRLWHDRPGLARTRFQLMVSDDNRSFRPYLGPLQLTIGERRRRAPVFAPAPTIAFADEAEATCVEFSALAIEAPYIAVEALEPTELGNTLAALVEVIDVDGRPVVFTHGLVPVQDPDVRTPDWRTCGIGFDGARGTDIPGRGWTFTQSGGRFRHAVGSAGFIGIARGRNNYLGGMVELAYPQARQWLVGCGSAALDAGCDGVDIRFTTHTESLDYENYGFGPPVIEAYRRRYGVDIAATACDRAAWRRLRGSFVDQLLAEMGEAVRGRGKELSVQLGMTQDRLPDETCMHEIFMDWRRWCRDRLMDIANLNSFRFAGSFYPEAVKLCHDLGVPMMMTPSMFSANDEAWAKDGRELFERCRSDGIDIFNIYESSTVVRLTREGFKELVPSLWRMVDEFAARVTR
jgi:hypothetical protein